MTPIEITTKLHAAWTRRFGSVPSGLCGKVNGKLFDLLVAHGYEPTWCSGLIDGANHCWIECDGWRLDAAWEAVGGDMVQPVQGGE